MLVGIYIAGIIFCLVLAGNMLFDPVMKSTDILRVVLVAPLWPVVALLAVLYFISTETHE